MPARRVQEEDTGANDLSATAEGEAGETVDWTYLDGSNATTDGFGVVHVGANDTGAWEDVFPNGSTVKIVYFSGSGSSDTIVIVPDDDSSASESDSYSSASAPEDSSSGSLTWTVNPVYTLPSSNSSSSSSSSSGPDVLAESSSPLMSAVSYSLMFGAVGIVVVIVGVFTARRYTRKRRGAGNPDEPTRTYDLSAMFNANRSRRRTSSPSILGEEAESWRHHRSTDLHSSSLRPTSILADNETLAPLRPTVTLTPLRRTDRLVQATLEANRLRSSTAPVVLYQTP